MDELYGLRDRVLLQLADRLASGGDGDSQNADFCSPCNVATNRPPPQTRSHCRCSASFCRPLCQTRRHITRQYPVALTPLAAAAVHATDQLTTLGRCRSCPRYTVVKMRSAEGDGDKCGLCSLYHHDHRRSHCRCRARTAFINPAHPPYPDMAAAARACRAGRCRSGLPTCSRPMLWATSKPAGAYGVGMSFHLQRQQQLRHRLHRAVSGPPAVASGMADCVLALGFQHMNPGALGAVFTDRPSPFDPADAATAELVGRSDIPLALRYFGGAGAGAHAAVRHAAAHVCHAIAPRPAAMRPTTRWPAAQTAHHRRRDGRAHAVGGVMTRLMACPPTCGAAAAVVCSTAPASTVWGRACASAPRPLTTDTAAAFWGAGHARGGGFFMARRAARQVYEQAGIGPQELDVVELHDCFAHNELLSYEALGLCGLGGAERFVADGDNTYGGQIVTNPSGGLLSKGHPLVQPGWRNAPNWFGSCAGEPGRARWKVPAWVCSTTWGWAVRASSRCTSRWVEKRTAIAFTTTETTSMTSATDPCTD